MGHTQTFTEVLCVVHCAHCGIPFGMTQDFEQRRRNDHEGFYCPKGHSNWYSSKSEAEILKQQLQEKERENQFKQQRIDSLHNTVTEKNNSIRSLKGAKTRMMNRVKNGVCPCCNRMFADLQRHFKSKHPEMVIKEEAV